MKLTILIPMYNEQAILPDTLATLSAYAREHFVSDYELLFVDDGSTDGSAEIVENYPDEATRVLRYTPNRGKGCAVRTGMLDARGERILFTDCDLAYGVEALGDLLAFWDAHPEADAVVGSRPLHPDGYRGYTLLRKLFSRTYRFVLRLFFGLRLSDSQSGLKGFSRTAAREIFSRCEIDRFAFDFEAIMIGETLGLRFAEMPACVVNNRTGGKVSLVKDSLRMLRDLFRIRRRVRRIKR
ncbi:MAG: glycosyltransferase [Clostridia bacterium]|nr:glycosyltransferase [Clostridia bacterium]